MFAKHYFSFNIAYSLSSKKKPTSEVDDQFFNLDDFNKWTEKQEELDMMSDREDQDDEFDFDNDLGDEEDSNEEEEDDAAGKIVIKSCAYGIF